MTPSGRKRRRRSSSKAFAPKTRTERVTPWAERLLLGVVPGVLFLAHLTFGANQTVASLWLTTMLAVMLCVGLAIPQARMGLFGLKRVWAPAILFALVIGVALLTLTPWTPGGPHPIWEWAGVSPGSSSVNRSATTVEIIKLLGLGGIFTLGCLQAARGDRARTTVEVLLIIGAVYAGVALLAFLTGTQLARNQARLTGGFLSPNSAATVFGMLSVIGLADLLRRWRRSTGLGPFVQASRVATWIGLLLLSLTCLMLTASRMGLAATAIAAAVLLVWELFDDKTRKLPILIGGAVLLLAGLALLAGGDDGVWGRLDQVGADALVRGDIFKAHWQAFLASPLFGYGLGSFTDINTQIITAESYEALWMVRATHNVYLQWLEEAGIIGAAPMFALIAIVLASTAWGAMGPGSGKTLMRGLFAASLVVLIHGTTDFGLQVPSIAAFWAFVLGLGFAFSQSRN